MNSMLHAFLNLIKERSGIDDGFWKESAKLRNKYHADIKEWQDRADRMLSIALNHKGEDLWEF